MKQRALILVLAAVSLAMFSLRPEATVPVGPVEVVEPVAAKQSPGTTANTARTASRADGTPGSWYQYSLAISSRAELDPDGEHPGEAQLALRISGRWRVELLEDGAGRRLYRAALQAPSLELAGAQEAALSEIEEGLAGPHLIVLGDTGQVLEIQVPPETHPTTWRMWFAIASAAQFSRGDEDEWTAVEVDPAGEYVAEYRRLTASRFEKRKLSYQRVRSGSQWISKDELTLGLDGVMTVLRGEGDWPERVSGSEVSWTEPGTQVVGARVRTEFELSLLGSGQGGSGPLADGHTFSRAIPVSTALGELQGAAKTFAELREDLLSDGQGPSFVIPGLAHLFAEDDTAIGEAMTWLRSDPAADQTFVVAGALSRAGTPAALAALVEMTKDTALPEAQRVEALVELGRTARPTEAALEALRDAMGEPSVAWASTAALALGNAADALSSTDIVNELVRGLAQARDRGEVLIYLAALGNTASVHAFDAIRARVAGGDPMVRGAALEALGALPDPRADGILATALVSDESAGVRARVAAALGGRRSEPGLGALSTAARGDRSPQVRGEVAHALSRFGATHEGARSVLVWLRDNDGDAAVRQTAQALL